MVISDALDELISHTRGYGTGSRPEDYLDAFADYIKTHINEIAALNIVCTRPKELTRASLKDLRLTLDREGFTTQQLNTAVSELTNEEMTADIISLIRRYAIGSTLISHEARIRRAVDNAWTLLAGSEFIRFGDLSKAYLTNVSLRSLPEKQLKMWQVFKTGLFYFK